MITVWLLDALPQVFLALELVRELIQLCRIDAGLEA
jgi:hypothetical protein